MAAQGGSPIAGNEVLTLFPTLVWRVQLTQQSFLPLNRALRARLDALAAGEAPLRPEERLRTGGGLHRLEEVRPLADFVRTTAGGVLRYLKIVHESIEVASCWADVRAAGARLAEESDPNAYLSALYHVSVPEGGEQVRFRDPRGQRGIIDPPRPGGAPGASGYEGVTAGAGTLLVFPAWLARSMERNPGESAAVSLGFSLMFDAFIETVSKPIWQGNTMKRA